MIFPLACFHEPWNILQGNGYSLSAKAFSYLIVYSCVFSSFACMTETFDFPVRQVAMYNLWVACKDVEWNFGLGYVEFCYEV